MQYVSLLSLTKVDCVSTFKPLGGSHFMTLGSGKKMFAAISIGIHTHIFPENTLLNFDYPSTTNKRDLNPKVNVDHNW